LTRNLTVLTGDVARGHLKGDNELSLHNGFSRSRLRRAFKINFLSAGNPHGDGCDQDCAASQPLLAGFCKPAVG
jgi:hypothetical protein